MAKRDLLIEIGTEEIPAQLVVPAATQLRDRVTDWLQDERIAFEKAVWLGTPRRFSVLVSGVDEKQQTLDEESRGPAKRIAVDDAGDWTKAAIGFARGQGVATEELYFKPYKGEAYVFARKEQAGDATEDLLKKGIEGILLSLTFAKSMRWGDHTLRFVRPIRWLVTLFGSQVIPIEVAGITSGNVTHGHRFLGRKTEVVEASAYEETLRKQYVIVCPDERRELIREQLERLADANDWVIPVDDDLLEEITYLVEYPTAVSGTFDSQFLDIPADVLMTSMRTHQRYFPVKSKEDKLLPHFVTVRNGDDTALDIVAKGNERVLRARLADARFFYQEDQKQPLSFFTDKLAHVVFHEQLGTIADKVERIRSIAEELAASLGFDEKAQAEIDRSAALSKFDLETLMVDEFPEMQGRMGQLYADIAGESPEVASGILEHYFPRFADDRLPTSQTGLIVGLADKMDTIAACFSIGIIPTGSTDPYALRRQASGIVQVIMGKDVPLSLQQLFTIVLDELDRVGLLQGNEARKHLAGQLKSFFAQRLRYVLQNKQVRYDVIDAVLASGSSQVQQAVLKADCLMKQLDHASFKRTVEAFTRVETLAAKAEKEQLEMNEDLNEEQAEKQLTSAYREALRRYNEAEQNNRVTLMYEAIASLEEAIHTYFAEVMVMVDDISVQRNRLALLQAVSDLIRRFAHFNHIVFA